MEFDRTRIKEEAKARMRQTRPRPWQVSLAYVIPLFLLPFLLILLLSLFIALPISPLHGLTDSPSVWSTVLFLIYLIALAPLVLLQAGYCFYSIKLWRREPTGYRDLLYGCSVFKKVFALWGLLLLLSLLWSLPFFLITVIAPLIPRYVSDPSLQRWLILLPMAGAYILIFSRMLYYSLSLHVLVDHPDYTARQVLKESRILMAGQRWRLFLFFLSFIGWYLLEYVIVYVVSIAGVLLFFPVLFLAPSDTAIVLLFLLILLLFLASTTLLLLWLLPYVSTSLAGIYDCLQGRPLIPPAPPWNGPSAPIPFGD